MIDVHAHLFFEELLGQAGPFGPRLEDSTDGCTLTTGLMSWSIRDRDALAVSPEDRVRALESAHIDLQVVTISPLWLFHHAPAHVAVPFARQGNDLLAAWCERANGKAVGLAQLPVQDPQEAARELRRGVEQLGLRGGYLGSDARSHLDSCDLDPIYEACTDLDVPLFVHAAMPGIDGPPGDSRLDRWVGHAVVGYPMQDTVAVSDFLFGDVLDRHPALDVCFSHGGGAIALLWGRLQAFAGTARSPIDNETLQRRLHRLWFDDHVHHDAGARLLHDVVNRDRLVFGSNFGGWDHEDPGEHPDESLTANAQALLRL